VKLTKDPITDWAPATSPDVRLINFQIYLDGNWESYMMLSDGLESTNLSKHSSDAPMPFWQPVMANTELCYHYYTGSYGI
jgi:hypothetical protein